MGAAEGRCFHCGELLIDGSTVALERGDTQARFCCPACCAVFELIHRERLDGYYRTRRQAALKPAEAVEDYAVFDTPDVQSDFVTCGDDGCEARLFVEGVHCSACTWLIEKHVGGMPGVREVNVQLHQQVAIVGWDPDAVKLSHILAAIAALGYRALPHRPSEKECLLRKTRRAYLRRLGVAGIASMQVGMFAIALYAGAMQDMSEHWRDLFRHFSLLLATLVVVYAAQPFFAGAWRGLRRGMPGMDLPVALAIGLAYGASVWATLKGGGEVYFDSVTMFTLLLLASRYMEFRARSSHWFFPHDLLPETVLRCDDAGWQRVPLRRLQPGNRVRVLAGETIPVDGRITGGSASVNEAAFTGEFYPVHRQVGDNVYAGTVNGDGVLDVSVTAVRGEAALHAVERLVERAVTQKPRFARRADILSRYFVVGVLLVCGATALYWWRVAPQHALWISLSVLVVTCPCALSLATPTALSAALRRLQALGVLVTRGHVLESAQRLRYVVMDKTGTLTQGRAVVQDVRSVGAVTREEALVIAAALERDSAHPLAKAFHDPSCRAIAEDVRFVSGEGVEGVVGDGCYRLGSAAFCGEWLDRMPAFPDQSHHWVGLCRSGELLAWFAIADSLRPDAQAAVAALKTRGLEVHLLSGDSSGAVEVLARRLGIDHFRGGASPHDKLAYVQALQRSGAVMMVGDGINDMPVMASSDISVAMSEASDLNKTRADCVLLTPRLAVLDEMLDFSARTVRTIRQNFAWALSYNGLALPLAVAGMIPPWAAAIGMSLSSLLVVGNSQRLARWLPPAGQPTAAQERPADAALALKEG